MSSQNFYESMHCRHITRNARSFIHKLDGIFDLRVSALHRAMYGTYSPFSAAFLFLFLLCLLLLLSHPPDCFSVSHLQIPFTLIFTVPFTLPTNLIHPEHLPGPLTYSPKYNPPPHSMGFLYPAYQSFCICLSLQFLPRS